VGVVAETGGFFSWAVGFGSHGAVAAGIGGSVGALIGSRTMKSSFSRSMNLGLVAGISCTGNENLAT
jgi:hypothetical protein